MTSDVNDVSSDLPNIAPMRVFHGITGAAGQPASVVKALRAEGIDAVNYLVGANKYGYGFDRLISSGTDLHASLFDILANELSEFDVFHFYFRSLFYNKKDLAYPTGLDLVLLRLMGKKLILNFRGSEARIHSRFKELSPFNYVDEDPDGLATKFPENAQKDYIEFVSSVCNHILVPDPELQSYVPNATIVPRSIDLDVWQASELTSNPLPLVVHAPSRRVVKGTKELLAAVEALRAEGLKFEFRLVEGVSNEEARALYRRADIIVDQLRIGWYGVLAVEGMALRKAVISYVRDDLVHHLGPTPPMCIANPASVKDALRKLVLDESLRRGLADRALDYCRQTHDSRKIASKLIAVYKSEGQPVDRAALIKFLSAQHSVHLSRLQRNQETIKQQEAKLRTQSEQLEQLQSMAQRLEAIKRKLGPLLWTRRRLMQMVRKNQSGEPTRR